MENVVPVEFELQRKPPRNVVNRGGTWGETKPFLILLLPHVWIAVIAPFVLVGMYMSSFAAEPFPGKITARYAGVSTKSGPYHNVDVEFKVGDKTFKTNDRVSANKYDLINEGDPITVYALRVNPSLSPHLDKDGKSNLPSLFFGTIWTTMWCGITFSIVWVVLSQPLRSKRLVRDGIAITGTLDAVKEETNRNGLQYKALYSFNAKQTDKATGRTAMQFHHGKMSINKEASATAQKLVGQGVTILIDEKNPKSNIIYQFCDHQAVT